MFLFFKYIYIVYLYIYIYRCCVLLGFHFLEVDVLVRSPSSSLFLWGISNQGKKHVKADQIACVLARLVPAQTRD